MNRLKDLREEKDLYQKDISNILKISRSTYSSYEIEFCEISIESLRTLSSFYNTSIDYIFYRTDVREPYKKSKLSINGNKNRLKEIRKYNNKTQKQIATELKMPLKSYIKYENMSRSLNVQLMSIFADFYNTSIDYILCNTDEIKPHKKSIVDWSKK